MNGQSLFPRVGESKMGEHAFKVGGGGGYKLVLQDKSFAQGGGYVEWAA